MTLHLSKLLVLLLVVLMVVAVFVLVVGSGSVVAV